jgi:hypothetical protein
MYTACIDYDGALDFVIQYNLSIPFDLDSAIIGTVHTLAI